MATSISIESLLTTLNGLKQEKTCLGQKLESMRARKESLREHARALLSKRNQVKEMNAKMNETLNVAKHKVQHTLEEERAIEEEIERKGKERDEISAEIDRVKDMETQDILQFQQKMSDLAEKLINARTYYQPENLEKEEKRLEEADIQLLNDKTQCELETQAMIGELERMEVDKENQIEASNQLIIPGPQQRAILTDWKGCINTLDERLNAYTEKKEAMVVRLERAKHKLKMD